MKQFSVAFRMDIVKTHQGVLYVDRESGHSYIKIREGKAGQAFLRCSEYRFDVG